ncbi:MAG: PorT family protein [Prevotellaceae bacterium]|jgi:hypothetical protein|nr:PorT family protein [Prevotellaceae bacterium]
MSNDKLKDLFHEKLYNHQTEVQQSDWEIISERIKKKRRRKIIPLLYIYGVTGVAVALLIIMFLIKPDTTNIEKDIISKPIPAVTTKPEEKTTSDNQNNNDTNKNQNQNQNEFTDITDDINKSTKTAYNQKNEYNIETKNQDANDYISKSNDKLEIIGNESFFLTSNAIEIITKEELSPKTVIAEKAETTIDKQETEKTINNETINDEWWNQPEPETTKDINKHKWTLALESGNNIGKGSVVSDFTNNTPNYNSVQSDFNTLPPIMSATPIATPESLKTEEPKTDINHRHPLNFGIRIKKNISKRIVVKTGLSYSYFLSEFSDSERKIQQQIHYVGIPVGFEFLLFQKNNFNIYLSGEFAAEKGVLYISKKSAIEISDIHSKAENGSVRGLQFSTNAGLGISYNFVKNIGIYVEPNTVYYIKDNRQPQSFRTEKTFNFGLNIGLKYDF